mmetsp:Transcript_17598/g.52868  ORF Transcript_17598/g.52868 Transcript_17598/m.52868 type:complete len:846 (+) Transcript_17598:182-2719(+)
MASTGALRRRALSQVLLLNQHPFPASNGVFSLHALSSIYTTNHLGSVSLGPVGGGFHRGTGQASFSGWSAAIGSDQSVLHALVPVSPQRRGGGSRDWYGLPQHGSGFQSFASQAVTHQQGDSKQPDGRSGASATPSSSGGGSSSSSSGQQSASASTVAAEISPQSEAASQCDEVLDGLRKTRSAYTRSRGGYREVSYTQRAKQLLTTVASGARTVLMFTLSVPGRLKDFAALTSAERRAVYAGWWAAIKKEGRHYWAGGKLLAADVRISLRLVFKVASGKPLSRREKRQLTRTSADIFRLVPLTVFLVVPFMELLLPVALKLFPNMLPSTFEDKLKKEEQLKKRLTAKLEVARFLQDTVADMAKDIRDNRGGSAAASADELYQFMQKVRAGEEVDNAELVKFAQLFNDELTLDNLERVHLTNLCRFIGVTPFGTDEFLRVRLRARLAAIKADDRAIKAEGLDALSESELREACRARGIRANVFGEGASKLMRKRLSEWLELSLNRMLPSSLLLLSRAFTLTQAPSTGGVTPGSGGAAADLDSLKNTLGALNKEVLDEVGLDVGQIGDLAKQYEKKLEQLKREEALIREEGAEAAAAQQPEGHTLPSRDSAPELAAAAAASAVMREAAAASVVETLAGESAEEKSAKAAAAREERMQKVLRALGVLASSSGVSAERQAFMELVRGEIERTNKQLAGRSPPMTFQRGTVSVERPGELVEVVGHERLSSNVSSILDRLESELDHVDSKIGESMHVLDMDNDGLISREELATAMSFLRSQLGEADLRHLLEQLDAFDNNSQPIAVESLIALAGKDGKDREGSRKRESLEAALQGPETVTSSASTSASTK